MSEKYKPWRTHPGLAPDKAINMFEEPDLINYDDLDRKVEEALGIRLPPRKDNDGSKKEDSQKD